jgi:23S rRNA C2498 (ribose-2'-O)-methylase RlmM
MSRLRRLIDQFMWVTKLTSETIRTELTTLASTSYSGVTRLLDGGLRAMLTGASLLSAYTAKHNQCYHPHVTFLMRKYCPVL